MAYFYTRTETPENVRIVFKYTPIYYVFVLIALAGMFLATPIFNDFCCSSTTMLIALILLLAYYADTRDAYAEYRRARKDGTASVSGSRWSFRNPLTVDIRKAQSK